MTRLKPCPFGPILVIAFVLTFLCAIAAAKNDGSGPPSAKAQNTQQSSKPLDPAAEGEKRFEINCGRCHRPPDSISPRISKTILQHMRVRAMLTQEDEYYILKYIAP